MKIRVKIGIIIAVIIVLVSLIMHARKDEYFTIALGITLAFIAYQQWLTNNSKLKLDLYNKRFEVYLATLTFYQGFIDKKYPDEETRYKFIEQKEASYFLFSKTPKIYETLDKMHALGVAIRAYKDEFDRTTGGNTVIDFDKNTDNVRQLTECMTSFKMQIKSIISL